MNSRRPRAPTATPSARPGSGRGRRTTAPGDLDELLIGHRKAADQRPRVHRGRRAPAKIAAARRRIAPQSIGPERAARDVAEEDVLGDGQIGEEAAAPGGRRRCPSARACAGPWRTRRLPVQHDLAGVRLVDPREDLDQRALAGAVLADERVDLAGPELEGDVRRAPASRRSAWRRRSTRRGRHGDGRRAAGTRRAGIPWRGSAVYSRCGPARRTRLARLHQLDVDARAPQLMRPCRPARRRR